ncbi:MAG: bifunctional nuclease family protein [Candidatus Aenigmatarchaeota archaeon]
MLFRFFRELNGKKLVQMVLICGIIILSLTVASIPLSKVDSDTFVEINRLHVIQDSTIVVGNNCTAIIAQTSPERAQSIALGLRGLVNVRPNTHDIFSDTLGGFNISLERIEMTNFEDGMYYARMILRDENKILKLDSKPSDAIAVALRTNSTMYINKTLLDERGKDICREGEIPNIN